jgi:hypothetical protein
MAMKRMVLLLALCLFMGSVSAQTDDCLMAREKVDSLWGLAKTYAEKQMFISADSYYKAAEQQLLLLPNCPPLPEVFQQEHASVVAASVYQQMLEKTVQQQDQNKFAEAINSYALSGKYYAQFEVFKNNLTHAPLLAFALENCKAGFLRYMAEDAQSKNNFASALDVYQSLLQRGYPFSDLKRPLYDLGVAMGQADRALGKKQDPAKFNEAITAQSKAFSVLKRGYEFGYNP